MTPGQKKAPELGGGGSVSKEALSAKTTQTPSHNTATKSSSNLNLKRHVAESLLGEIHWKENGDSGYCTCPGRDLHSNANAKTDCQVWLGMDGRVPTIHCVHDSCCGPIADANHKLRSELGKIDASGRTATRAEIRESQERQRLYRLEKRKKELTGKAISSQLTKIIEKYPWPLEQVMEDSPISPRDIWSFGKPDRVPEWTRLIDLIFQPGDLIFVGEREDVGSDHFKTKEEWLRIYQRPNAPQLQPKKGLYLSMWSWKPGSIHKTKANRLHRRSLVLESDDLFTDTLHVFKWLQINLRLRAIVFSGDKSFHGWFDPPGEKKEKQLEDISRNLELDPSMFSKSFARLPGVTRPNAPYEGWRQELCFLDRKVVAA